jgi:hypothetical protein
VEVAAVVIAVPRSRAARSAGSVVTWAAGPTGSVVARSTRSAGSVVTWAAGPAGSVVTWAAGPAGSVVTRSTRATGPAGSVVARSTGSGATWPTRSTRPARSVAASAARVLGSGSSVADRGCAMATRLRPRSGAGRTGPHAQRGCPEGAGDGRSGHQLLQFHGPSPVYLDIQRTLAPRRTER